MRTHHFDAVRPESCCVALPTGSSSSTGVLPTPSGMSGAREDDEGWSIPHPRAAGRADSPLDELFVAGARFHEPSARERSRAARRVRRTWSGRPVRRGAVSACAAVGLVLGLLVLDVPDPSLSRLQVVVAVPLGWPTDPGLVAASEHEVAVALAWLEGQIGRPVRMVDGGARTVELPLDVADLRGDSRAVADVVMNEVRAAVDDSSVAPLVIAPVRTSTAPARQHVCGLGGPAGITIFLGNCDLAPSTTARWPSLTSTVVAHEVVHALGAVGDCAPGGTADGHVADDPGDLMYSGPLMPGREVRLDVDRADYLGHGNAGCPDILDSPLLD